MDMLTCIFVITVIAVIIAVYLSRSPSAPSPQQNNYWGATEVTPGESNTQIKPFKVEFPQRDIDELHRRLDSARVGHTELENAAFQYGFRPSVMKDVVHYWKHDYNWKKQEDLLNSLPQFVTEIEGIDIHFIHSTPENTEAPSTAVPLLLVHGWPGSTWELYKMIPILTGNDKGDTNQTFQVVCPSLPGYGFSQAACKKGMDTVAMGSIFVKLMVRLGYSQFYVQGGDWGAVIAANMAQFYPKHVLGAHLNMISTPAMSPRTILTLLGLKVCPRLLLQQEEIPFISQLNKNLSYMLKEGGYLHIQATKPDTIAFALNDSPVGLAAYILEKFSSWTNLDHLDRDDGGLTSKFTLDDLLTNVMIYWINGNIGSSMRLYKEHFRGLANKQHKEGPVTVPVGLALFPHDIFFTPKVLAAIRFKNIVQYSVMPAGGHFAAMEEPLLLANDLRMFVRKAKNTNSS